MARSQSSDIDGCIQWAKDNGSTIPDFYEFKKTPGFGVSCFSAANTTTSQQGTPPSIKVPRKLLITNDVAKEYFQIADNLNNYPNNTLIKSFLCVFKFGNVDAARNNFFSPYINVLPDTLTTSLTWSDEQLEMCKGTDLYLKTKRLRNKIQEEYEKYCVPLFNNRSECKPCITDYLWAHSIITSRGFPSILLNDKRNSENAFLLPIIDFFNHKADTKTKWTPVVDTNNEVIEIEFSTLEKYPKPNLEIFNNYGMEKSNEDLIINYGFLLEDNKYDSISLNLKLGDEEAIEIARKMPYNIKFDDVLGDAVRFDIKRSVVFPVEVLKFFSYICKLRSENYLTLRSTFEGLDQLAGILSGKIAFFKRKDGVRSNGLTGRDDLIIRIIKLYKTTQRKLFQNNLDIVEHYQKQLMDMKKNQMISFKQVFKRDKIFANALLLAFGCENYESLGAKKILNHCLMLWLIRLKNCYDKGEEFDWCPFFIIEKILVIDNNISIEREDIEEYGPVYKSLFPKLSRDVPDVFNVGNWGIRQFIVAAEVVDKLCWTRGVNNETYIMEQVPYNIV
ncbi:uncharacterized protein SCODWIG_03329 [Saccharomycodes ludwigii]|uniref:Uncharacterized protein n=1 Tax=Saccharomycodes ludwigii TaxID=36035 RepID=A0A376BA50_9ASCO|nr:hypothetical protein SCDLUD_001337 [Saccharomycodes ludwigii]KAH3901574.1 hypothetical protein SCDLUD_001337 [Saccharomycodes ludwigii]SSD61568.1 uncharacterized protein SCODWIG_03329 [Saccharomycodes ludwigii]